MHLKVKKPNKFFLRSLVNFNLSDFFQNHKESSINDVTVLGGGGVKDFVTIELKL